MTTLRTFTSSPLDPADRGRELGRAHGEQIARTVNAYRRLFAARATRPLDMDEWSDRAWAAITDHAPVAAAEIGGIAEGAGLPVTEVAMLNARTELLAVADPTGRGVPECSTVVALPGGGRPVAVQTWDWYDAMSDNWFVWTIRHPDGHVVQTVTEYGVLGKIGVSSAGVGVMFNMLRHRDDALTEDKGLGLPVHLLSRQILDRAHDVDDAVALARAAAVSASSSITVVDQHGAAASVELFPGGPGVVQPDRRLLVRTNHFLSEEGAPGCLAENVGTGSRTRRTTLLRAFDGQVPATADEVLTAMTDHNPEGAVCAHPEQRLDPDLDPVLWHATLATVALDVVDRTMDVRPGGPCRR